MLVFQLEKGAIARFYFKEEFGAHFCEHGGNVFEQYYTDPEDAYDEIQHLEEFVDDIIIMTPLTMFSLSQFNEVLDDVKEK
jgi:hypothetical protein